jgi:uncharacterized protein YbaP (TraB family)
VRCLVPLCFLLIAAGCASEPAPAPPARRPTPLAYDLIAPNGARALLLGSVHLASRPGWTLPGDLADVLAEADVLVFEVDLTGISAPEALRWLGDLGRLPPGVRLRDRISPLTWQLLERRAPALGVPLGALEHLEPWLVALEFTARTLAEAGFGAEFGVEHEIRRVAHAKPTRGLETTRDQLLVFDGLAPALQERMLREALEPQNVATLESLLDAWRHGDRARLESLLFEDRDDPEMAPFYEALYTRRNGRMASALADILLHSRTAFVVVGVGHLLGERSLPHALRDQGFRVRRRPPGP